MSAVFLKILNMSITASWLILVVIAARELLKAAPKWIACLLWGMVAVRLVCPVSFESIFSLIPNSDPIPAGIAYQANPAVNTGIPSVNDVINPAIAASFTPDPGDSANPLQIVIPIAAAIWIAGILLMLAYALISYMKLRKTVAICLSIGGNVFACDEIDTPFILGIFRPEIYVPSSVRGDTLDQVLLHESAHLQRHDHWWKPLGYLLLTVHWFNPLCWIAYILLCRDIEMACDERVIRMMDAPARAAYSQALLDCSFSRRQIAACPLAFGEVGVKERIRGVLNYKKPAFWLIFAAVIICLTVAICFLTNPKYQEQDISSLVRTEFIGDAPEVVAIAGHLPYPGDYSYSHIEIQSGHEPYELTVYLNGTGDIGQSEFDEVSRLAFDQIGNMGVIRFCREENGEVIAVFSRPVLADPDEKPQAQANDLVEYQEKNAEMSADDIPFSADTDNQEGVLVPYAPTQDGQWEADGKLYRYCLVLEGRMKNAKVDSTFTVLSNDKDVTFEEVAERLFSSQSHTAFDDKDAVLVRWKVNTKEQNTGVEPADEIGTESGRWLWPLEKTHEIGDSFGRRVHPLTGEERMHDHVNLRAEDNEWVVAAVGGIIKDIQYDPQMGNMVTVDVGGGIEIEYGHLAKVGVTGIGELINTGDVIGTAGATGMATGTNLSFKVTIDGEPIDPLQFLGE